jgi:hypothetical protein
MPRQIAIVMICRHGDWNLTIEAAALILLSGFSMRAGFWSNETRE